MLLLILKIVLSVTAIIFFGFIIFIFGFFIYGLREGFREERGKVKIEATKQELSCKLKIYAPEED